MVERLTTIGTSGGSRFETWVGRVELFAILCHWGLFWLGWYSDCVLLLFVFSRFEVLVSPQASPYCCYHVTVIQEEPETL